ncbi:hypothetical protein J7E97_07710 [Streptomyces sp. ISL-66]|uniref:hypothetical protein n=1 Tax=Streptomyces sp. ISL-66 TaxID=2819186 RepID=UPI001BEC9007|nr:hypothetical protein [Streptomyces sp. ISL-66]MBT2467759.1 hypothetical protein [Streptomyces sp. ISL-66]
MRHADSHETDAELLEAVSATLGAAGFGPGDAGETGVHLILHARGVMVGWTPQEIDDLHTRTHGPPPAGDHNAELTGLRHATGLALAAALHAAGFTTETHSDSILVLPPPPPG